MKNVRTCFARNLYMMFLERVHTTQRDPKMQFLHVPQLFLGKVSGNIILYLSFTINFLLPRNSIPNCLKVELPSLVVMAKTAQQSNLLMVRKCRTCHKIQFSFLFCCCSNVLIAFIQLCRSIEISSSKSILMFFEGLKSSSFQEHQYQSTLF